MTEANSAEEKFRNRILNSGSDIPDANKIHEARKKRELLRRIAQDPSYVSLKGKKTMKSGESRLMTGDSDEEEPKVTHLNG